MGSLFLVVVPVRSFELKLRLNENELLQTLASPINAPEAIGQETILKTMKGLDTTNMRNSLDEGQFMMAKDICLPPSKEHIISYNLKSGTFLLQLTRDTMKLMRADSVDPSTGRVRRVSIISGADIAIHDSDEDTTSIKSNSKRRSTDSYDDLQVIELIDSKFLERHMEDVLTKFDLLSCSWETSIDNKFSRICFSVDGAKADRIINHLHAIGIGKKYESTLSVCATTVFTQEKKKDKDQVEIGSSSEEEEGKWNNFLQSIKARITVAQVVENVKANAVITFDFLIMLIVAGIIAALGLLEDSPVNLIASMLVSPLMGPIMAFTFGAMIRDYPLIKTGIISELIGLFLCLLVGFLFGIFLELQLVGGPWQNVQRWPTNEMVGRGRKGALIVGAAVAIPSGAGVALSILAGNAGSLVGVAISASLLPPCVNCGIFYGLALVISIRESLNGNHPFSVPCDQSIKGTTNATLQIGHTSLYCNNLLKEFAICGSISLCLTLLNIVLIFFTGLIVLKIKEVAPYTTKTAFERFWKHDVKHARDYNLAHDGDGALLQELVDDPMLLDVVQEDFVFNQVQTRAMYRGDNVIAQVKEKRSRQQMNDQGGWLAWFGTGSKTGPHGHGSGPAHGPAPVTKSKKNVVHPQPPPNTAAVAAPPPRKMP